MVLHGVRKAERPLEIILGSPRTIFFEVLPPRWRGLNNRRDNLLVCTARRHQACRGPLGDRRFVGVYWHGNICEARIRYRGKTYYLGYFHDAIEAAKARDRKAGELCGELASLNSPEDLPMLRKLYRKKRPGKHKGAKKSRS